MKYFRDEFGPNQSIYSISSNDSRIDGLASHRVVFLYNKSGETLIVEFAGGQQTFTAYEVKFLVLEGAIYA